MIANPNVRPFMPVANGDDGPPRLLRLSWDHALVEDGADGALTIGITRDESGVTFSMKGRAEPPRCAAALAVAVEALTAADRELAAVRLSCGRDVAEWLLADGLVMAQGAALVIPAEFVWQRASLFLPGPARPTYPQLHVVSGGRRHPTRPPKPAGDVYRRSIPWLQRMLSFRALRPEADLPLFHRWMNDPRVSEVWEEQGDLDAHRRSLAERAADPHLLMLIGEFDGEPFGYFELYWAKENRVGPHYDADDYDRGWHVLIGEEAFRGRDFITAWLPSLMHYAFLAEPRTRRMIGEPRASHAQQIRNLDRAGFAKIKHFDFPHKRALLVMLLRERFFGDRLWAPEPTASPI